ncbi:hypothetical protein BGZ61DRAFT_524135 [Ilyonectria robusta]|uniref:uncharacterized protein n=1 Tax=Ilyonectria robusta TaxID=1079257 RepID=UPI001E8EA3DD|nr:uncharacterized protein BGZ61DRAFT_524135 [Ilyonectria robusta]KAH8654808.1 hypothetical protein BGZ61DRAFT_524135 [Ilyonectria robusta]
MVTNEAQTSMPPRVERIDTSPREQCKASQTRIELTPNVETRSIFVPAISTEEAMTNMANPYEEVREVGDDARISTTHEQHHEISWTSCIIHSCETHLAEKIKHNAFPRRQSNNVLANPYLKSELQYWSPQTSTCQHEHIILAPDVREKCLRSPFEYRSCQDVHCEIHKEGKVRDWHKTQEDTRRREELRIKERSVYIRRMRSLQLVRHQGLAQGKTYES